MLSNYAVTLRLSISKSKTMKSIKGQTKRKKMMEQSLLKNLLKNLLRNLLRSLLKILLKNLLRSLLKTKISHQVLRKKSLLPKLRLYKNKMIMPRARVGLNGLRLMAGGL